MLLKNDLSIFLLALMNEIGKKNEKVVGDFKQKKTLNFLFNIDNVINSETESTGSNAWCLFATQSYPSHFKLIFMHDGRWMEETFHEIYVQ